ncbi:MAG: DUF2589 domain-containing protein [Pseudobutyrivibrio sp.]|nr:DUF2589 domain-containing protein [Pseudobutyrivibrio sp.]
MAKRAAFDDLVKAIQQAFIDVNDMSEEQHLRKLEEYFEEDGTPKVFDLQYPYFDENGVASYKVISVPQICLVPITSLKLDDVEVDFKVRLYGDVDLHNQDGDKQDTFLGYIPHGKCRSNENSYASIKLKFTSQDPPEGLLRLRDQFVKVTL